MVKRGPSIPTSKVSNPVKDSPPPPTNIAPNEATPPHENGRPFEEPPPASALDVRRYRPGIVFIAVLILLACTVSYMDRLAGDRVFPDAPKSCVVCRAPDGTIDVLPRGTTVGAALGRWELETAGIDKKTLKRKVPDGSRIGIVETRAGRRVVVAEMPGAERYALGLDFDINAASAPDLALLPGVGDVSAARIIAWRKRHGDFRSEEDLRAVPGLTGTIARTVARYVTFGPKTYRKSGPASGADRDAPSGDPGKLAEGAPVDINRAAAADLMRIPGVGEVTAGRIIEARENGGAFKTVADLERVKGIGKKKAETIGAYVRF